MATSIASLDVSLSSPGAMTPVFVIGGGLYTRTYVKPDTLKEVIRINNAAKIFSLNILEIDLSIFLIVYSDSIPYTNYNHLTILVM